MTPRPLLVIPDVAKEAMARTDKMDKERKVHPLIRRAVALHVRRQMFGPSMKATLRQSLLMWSSFRAFKQWSM